MTHRLLLMDRVDSDMVEEATLNYSTIGGCCRFVRSIVIVACWVLGDAWLMPIHHLLLQLFKLHRGRRQVKPIVIFIRRLVIDTIATRSGHVRVCPSAVVVRLGRLAYAVLICVLNRPDDVFRGAVICLFQLFA